MKCLLSGQRGFNGRCHRLTVKAAVFDLFFLGHGSYDGISYAEYGNITLEAQYLHLALECFAEASAYYAFFKTEYILNANEKIPDLLSRHGLYLGNIYVFAQYSLTLQYLNGFISFFGDLACGNDCKIVAVILDHMRKDTICDIVI